MRRFVTAIACTGLFTACLHAATTPSDPAKVFNDLYGKRVSEVAATPDPTDDIDLASTLIKNAALIPDSPQLAAVMYEHAYELSNRVPAGFDTAILSQQKAAALDPKNPAKYLQRIVTLRRRQFTQTPARDKAKVGEQLVTEMASAAQAEFDAGDTEAALASYRQAAAVAAAIHSPQTDTLRGRILELVQRQRLLAQAEQLKQRLKQNPTDDNARELILLYAVDLDNPAEARKYTFLCHDDALKQNVSLAASEPESLSETQMVTLGDWYADLARQASATAAGPMLARAAGYYQQFLAKHTAQDLQRSHVTLALDAVNKLIQQRGSSGDHAHGAMTGAIDLLQLIDPQHHAITGSWVKNADGLYTTTSNRTATLRVPVSTNGDYQIDCKIHRKSVTEAGHFSILLDVHGARVLFQLYHGGQRGRLKDVAGRAIAKRADSDPDLTLSIHVRNDGQKAAIESICNGKPFLSWTGPISSLTLPGDVSYPDPPSFGLEQAAPEPWVVTMFKVTVLRGEAVKNN